MALRRRAGCPLIASVARDEAALLCRGEACLLARTLDAFCLDGARNPAHFWMGAPAKAIALYLYGTNMKLCVRLGEPVGQMMGQPIFLHGAETKNGLVRCPRMPIARFKSKR